MSRTIDQRVVEMRFDNKQFESNVSTSMSTLDKLKQKLNFSGATKGFEDINSAAKKVNLNGLSSAVDTVQARFSGLQVVAVTALANITNSAVNAGKQIVSALTIDPVISGFQEYETQINAVQTILANTQSKGTTLDDVNAALDELNKYADQTIYNFTEMTRNIGTFTAAGVDLDKSVTSIKGIANLAAVSGSNSQQAATAMYQLSQALAAGKVSLMDWNSVVNAGMGGELFQNALKRTATQMGYNVDALIEKYGSFRESLTQGQWLTAEVLTETLTQLSGAYTEADLIAQGYTEKQAKEIVALANTAVGAATDVKTFTQLIDTLKESVQSGWTQTWEILIGDFEEAKALWTEVSDVLGGVIQNISDARNNMLEGAMTSSWDKLIKKVNEAGVATEDFQTELEKTARASVSNFDEIIKKSGSLEQAFRDGSLSSDLIIETLKRMAGVTKDTAGVTEDMTAKLKTFQKVVNDVWQGDYKNGEERIKALTEAGYDYAEVQALVNKTVDGHKLTLEDLTDTQLKSVGYTNEEITALRELAEQAEKTGTPLNQLIEDMTKPSGRELLIDTFRNALTGLGKVLKAIGEAWRDAFPAMTSNQLYNIIEGVHSLSESLVPTEETVDKLTRTFKGLFAIIDIITTIVGGGFKAAFRVLTTVLGMADVDILTFTAKLGDAIVWLRDFLFENELVTKGLELVASGIVAAAKAVQRWIEAFLDLPIVQSAIENVSKGLSNLSDIGVSIIEGLQNGLEDGLTSIPQFFINLGKKIIEAIKVVLGIHSPSQVMFDIGQNIIQGLVNGIGAGVQWIITAIQNVGSVIADNFKKIDLSGIVDGIKNTLLDFASFVGEIFSKINLGALVGAIPVAAVLLIGKKIFDVVDVLTGGIEGLNGILEGFENVLNSTAKVLSGFSMKLKADALKSIATAIAILVGAVVVLTFVNPDKVSGAVAVLIILAGGLLALSKAISMIDASGYDTLKLAAMLLSIGVAMALMAGVLKIISTLDGAELLKGAAFASTFVVFTAALGVVAKSTDGTTTKLGNMMIKLAIALGLMVGVVKLIGMLDTGEMIKGAAFMAGFVVFVGLLGGVASAGGENVSKLGGMMIKMSIALGLMVGVVKLISLLDYAEMLKGAAFMAGFVTFVGLLVAVIKIGPEEQIVKIGRMMLALSTAMLLMVGVIALVGLLSLPTLLKGIAFMTAFVVFVGALVAVTKISNEQQIAKLSATILAMSVAIGILAGVTILLGLVSIPNLIKGITAVGLLSTFMALMIKATKGARNIKGNLIVMSVAIGVMAGAVAALSFIDPSKLAGATAALSILMGMFALIVQSSNNVKASLPTMITMAAIVAALGGIIYLLAGLPIDSVLGTTASLSILLLSLSASLKIISMTSTITPTAIVALAALGLIVAGLVGVLALITALDVAPSLETVLSLSTLLLAMSGAMVLLSLVGATGPASFIGIGALATLIVGIGGVMVAIGALAKHYPAMEEFLDKGLVLLEKIGYGIGSFVGNIVGGFLAGLTDGLPDIADNLSEFMDRLQPFIEGAGSIDESVTQSVMNLAKMMLALTAADLVNQIATFLGGGSSMTEFADQLVPFGEAMVDFSKTISGKIDEEAVTAAANAGLALANLANNIPKQGGVLQDFLGSQDLEEFGSQLVAFGEAIVDFSETVAPGGVSKISQAAVESAANAGKTLASLYDEIPRSGGVLQDFIGEIDLEEFGSQLVALGESLTTFSQTVAPEGSSLISQAAVDSATNAGLALAGLYEALPKSGGVMQDIFGEKDLEKFGTDIEAFGEGMAAYSEAIGTVDSNVVTSSANAAMALVDINNALKDNKAFTNETWINEFGEMLAEFGEGFSDYYDHIADIDAGQLGATTSQLRSLVSLAKSMEGIDTSGMSGFAVGLQDLANAGINNFITTFTEAHTKASAAVEGFINAAISEITVTAYDFEDYGELLIGNFIDGLKSKDASIQTDIGNTVGLVLQVFDHREPDFKEGGSSLMLQFISGLMSKIATAKSTVTSMLDQILTSINSRVEDFRQAGKDAVTGFANGISANSYLAVARAKTMAQQAVNTAKRELDEHSPSMVFFQIGAFAAMGLANGIKANSKLATDATKDMTDTLIATGEEGADGIGSGISDGISDATDQADALVEETADTIEDDSDLWEDGGKTLVEAFSDGIDNNTVLAANAAAAMGVESYQAALDAINAEAAGSTTSGSGSSGGGGGGSGLGPSRSRSMNLRTYGEGFTIDEKLSNIITEIGRIPAGVIDEYGRVLAVDNQYLEENGIDKTLDRLEQMLKYEGALYGRDDITLDDIELSISPVVDMDAADEAESTITSKFTSAIGKVQSAFSKAAEAASGKTSSSSGSTSSNVTVNYTQNNTSPKALSNVEIYRQTNKQLSTIERLVKA